MTPEDFNHIVQAASTAAEGAVSKAMMPVQRELGEIKGALNAGGSTMDRHESTLADHGRRLDSHDTALNALRRGRSPAGGDLSPGSGMPALTDRFSRLPEWQRELVMTFLRWGIPALLFLAFWAITHGAPIPKPF